MFMFFVATSMIGCVAQKPGVLQQSGKTHTVNKTIKGGTYSLPEGSTLVFAKGGKMVNTTVIGRNLRVIANGGDVAFQNCSFRGSLVNSQLQASNFGFIADMSSKNQSYTLKGLKIKTRKHTGTDNTNAWKQIAQFLSGSNGVKVTFNGSYYNAWNTEFVYIRNARNLELSGGTVIMGLRLADCNDVSIHDMRWVGYEEAHAFPPVYASKPVAQNGVNYTQANSYNAVKDRLVSCGLAGDAIKITTDTDGKVSTNFTVQRCHFEMRQNGLSVGERNDKRLVKNVNCLDCTARYIYFQPAGFHASMCRVDNMVADYCLQGVDMSTCSNNIVVTNSRFTRCAIGPKQESMTQFKHLSYNNAIEGCYFQITDDYLILDATQYILNVSEGNKGDVFTVRNTTFDVKKNRLAGSLRTRTQKVLLENVNINLDINLHPKSTDKWSMVDLFAVNGATSFNPLLELKNVTVNIASGTRVYDLCYPHGGGKELNIKATGLTVKGGGVVNTYFDKIQNVELTSSSLGINANSVAQGVTSLSATGCDLGNSKFFFVNDKENSSLKLNNNTIKSGTLVQFKTKPKLVSMSGNSIDITGNEAFSDPGNKANLNSNNFKVSDNTFKRHTPSAQLLPSNMQRKYTKLLKNNVVK